MDIANVYGDVFRACTFKSISYRVFGIRLGHHQSAHDEYVGSGALHRAEIALRQDSSNFMASLSQTGDELWVYTWEEEGRSAMDQPMNFCDLLYQFGAETVAQGVFLPPFTGEISGGLNLSRNSFSNALPNMTSFPAASTEDQSRYGPLVRAIELKFLDTLLKMGDKKQFEAFGTKGALSTGDGSVIRPHPILHQDGSLVVRLTSQKAQLVPLPINSIQMCAPLVWLLPLGKPCRILSALHNEDIFEPPNRSHARYLFCLLSKYCISNVTCADLEVSMWLRVSSADTGSDLLWPVVLIRATPLTTSGMNLTSVYPGAGSLFANSVSVEYANLSRNPQATNKYLEIAQLGGTHSRLGYHPYLNRQAHTSYNYPSRRPLVKLMKPAPYVALTEAMIAVRQEIKAAKEDSKCDHLFGFQGMESAIEKLRQTLNKPDAPPPSPRLNTTVPRISPSIMPSLVPTVNPTAAPTPTEITPASIAPIAPFLVYPTPSYQTPAATSRHTSNYGTPAAGTTSLPADSWMDIGEDNEEVGDADFNFFDLPLQKESHPDSTLKSAPPGSIKIMVNEPPAQDMMEDEFVPKSTLKTTQISYQDDKFDVSQQPITRFSIVDLRSSDLDSKYALGGRFFVPPPSHDHKIHLDDMPDSTRSDISDDSESDNIPFGFDDAEDGDFRESQVPEVTQHTFDDEDVEKAWLTILKRENGKYLPIDSSKYVSFRQLLPQIVYDGGMLAEIYEVPVVSGQTIVAPAFVRARLPWPMAHCSIGSISNECTDFSSRSRPPTPVRGALTAAPNFPNKAPASAKKMQLLSPPLVAFRRGDYQLKARVSILRFWRLLGLAPPLPDPNTQHLEHEDDQNPINLGKLKQDLHSDDDTEEPYNANSKHESQTKVVVVLVTIASPAVSDGARRFLNGFKDAYEGCCLGKIELPTFGSVKEGLLEVHSDFSHTSGDAIGDLFQTACSQLRTQLQTLTTYPENVNLLVIMSYPPSSLRGGTLTAIVPFQLAQGFSTIQGVFPESQWILNSLDSLVSRWDHDKQISAFEFTKFAHLAYARFPQFPRAIRLAGLVPHSTGLQYSADAPKYLMEDEPVLHVAYLIVEGRWCLVSWSDQWARKVDVDVLKLSDSSERSLKLVFAEILRHSDTLAKSIKDRPGWRLSVTKCGTMAASETSIWDLVIQSRQVIILDVPHPRGILVADNRSARPSRTKKEDDNQSVPRTSTSSDDSLVSSVGSFPASPVIHSPSSHVGPQRRTTPKQDGVIVDAADEIYGTSIDAPKAGVSRFAEACAQGYLVRPCVEGHVSLEARLLKIYDMEVAPRVVMSRVIGQFRRLASLSEFMGVTTESALVPWHIMALAKLEAAALKLNMS